MRQPENRRVVISAYEVSTPLGHGLDRTWERAAKNESGLGWITRFDPGDYPVRVVGEIPDYDPAKGGLFKERELGFWNARFIHLAVDLCRDALRKAGLEVTAETGPRIGAMMGSAIGGSDAYEEALRTIAERGAGRVSPFLLPNLCVNLSAGMASIKLGFTGPVLSVVSACATGGHAVAEAAWTIQRGAADAMLAGGVEFPLLPAILYGFGNMRTLFRPRDESDRAWTDPARASRPYSVDRRGFVLAEGGAILLLAELGFARRHKLPIIAEITGAAMTSDASHFTQPRKETIVRCIRGAIEDAGVGPGDIQHINGHGTSTTVGDEVELECLAEVFGPGLRSIPITSNKSQVGHSLAASAAIELALSAECLRRGRLLPTINIEPEDRWAHLDFVPVAREAAIDRVLSSSFGFGGTNCCVVLERFKES